MRGILADALEKVDLRSGNRLLVSINAEQCHFVSVNWLRLGRFRLAATANPAALRAPKTAVPRPEIAEILKAASPERTEEQKEQLAVYQRSAAPELIEHRRQLAEAKKSKIDFEATLPRCLVAVRADEPRTVRILPPGAAARSTTVTSKPLTASSSAALKPPAPAPTKIVI